MKVYIMTDMEGISGINSPDFCKVSERRYQEGRKFLTMDVNAAVEGAFEGGAKEVIVNDGHGSGPHILTEQLDKRAKYVRPAGAKCWLPGLDESVDICFSIGTHAKAGTLNAFLDHTQSATTIFRYKLGGIEMGELGQLAVIAGYYGVPVVMVTGDRAACIEAKQLLGKEVITVEVKVGVGREVAICHHPDRTYEMIKEAAKRAIFQKERVKPYKINFPCECEITFTRCDYADKAARIPGSVRKDGRTVGIQIKDVSEILLLFI